MPGLLWNLFTKIARIYLQSVMFIWNCNAGLFQRVWLRPNSRTWRCIKSWIKRCKSSTACEEYTRFSCQPFQQCFMCFWFYVVSYVTSIHYFLCFAFVLFRLFHNAPTLVRLKIINKVLLLPFVGKNPRSVNKQTNY